MEWLHDVHVTVLHWLGVGFFRSSYALPQRSVRKIIVLLRAVALVLAQMARKCLVVITAWSGQAHASRATEHCPQDEVALKCACLGTQMSTCRNSLHSGAQSVYIQLCCVDGITSCRKVKQLNASICQKCHEVCQSCVRFMCLDVFVNHFVHTLKCFRVISIHIKQAVGVLLKMCLEK